MQLDYQILKHLTAWTIAANWHQTTAYILAELLIFLFPATLFLLWQQPEKRGHFHSARKAVMMAIMATVLGLAVKTTISIIWLRPRPFITHPDLPHMVLSLDQPSFPSAHSLISMAIALSLFYSGYRLLGGVLIGASCLVALGRLLAGVHYPSDVLGGLLIGALISWYLHREASSIRKYLPNK